MKNQNTQLSLSPTAEWLKAHGFTVNDTLAEVFGAALAGTLEDRRTAIERGYMPEEVRYKVAGEERTAFELRFPHINYKAVINNAPLCWIPPLLEESDLTTDELALLKLVDIYLAETPETRTKVFLRFLLSRFDRWLREFVVSQTSIPTKAWPP